MPSPRLLFVGDFSASRMGNQSVAEALAARLRRTGWSLGTTSAADGPLRRALGMLVTLFARRRRIDIVVIDVYSGRAFWWAEAVSRLASRCGLSQILVLRGGGLARFAVRRPGSLERLLARADRAVAPSPYLADVLQTARHPVEVIPNPVSLADYQFRLRDHVGPDLAWLRSLRSLYNPQMAVRALGRLRERHPEAHLTIYGLDRRDGTGESLRSLVSGAALEGSVELAGAVAKHDVGRYLARHDIFLNTSRVDNAPVSVLEALATGLPVVSTRVGGIPYLLEDARTALLVDSDDDASMAHAISRLLDEPGLAARLSRSGRELVENFTWEHVLPKWEKLFHGVRDPRDSAAASNSELA